VNVKRVLLGFADDIKKDKTLTEQEKKETSRKENKGNRALPGWKTNPEIPLAQAGFRLGPISFMQLEFW